MAYETGEFDANIAAAAGDDPALRAELLACFAESLSTQTDLLARARCDGNWHLAAMRLRGLGSSFHAEELVHLADEAMDSAPGDPVVVRKLRHYSERFSG